MTPPRRGRPPGISRRTRERAEQIASALPAEGSIASHDMARAVGLNANSTSFKTPINVLRAENRLERPRPGRYARRFHGPVQT